MTIIRWILFLPIAAVCVAAAQFAAVTMAETLPWWVSVPAVVLGAVFILMVSYLPCGIICPAPLYGSLIFLAIFIMCESIAIIGFAPATNWLVVVARLYADGIIVLGGVGAAKLQRPAPIANVS